MPFVHRLVQQAGLLASLGLGPQRQLAAGFLHATWTRRRQRAPTFHTGQTGRRSARSKAVPQVDLVAADVSSALPSIARSRRQAQMSDRAFERGVGQFARVAASRQFARPLVPALAPARASRRRATHRGGHARPPAGAARAGTAGPNRERQRDDRRVGRRSHICPSAQVDENFIMRASV